MLEVVIKVHPLQRMYNITVQQQQQQGKTFKSVDVRQKKCRFPFAKCKSALFLKS